MDEGTALNRTTKPRWQGLSSILIEKLPSLSVKPYELGKKMKGVPSNAAAYLRRPLLLTKQRLCLIFTIITLVILIGSQTF